MRFSKVKRGGGQDNNTSLLVVAEQEGLSFVSCFEQRRGQKGGTGHPFLQCPPKAFIWVPKIMPDKIMSNVSYDERLS